MNIKIKLEEASKLCKENKLHDAKTIYLELIKLIPESPELLTNLGTIELHIGNINEGILLIQKSLGIELNQIHAISNLATALLEINKIEEALYEFKKGCILENENPEFYYNYARALRLANRFEEAIENYSKAILFNPRHYLAFNNRAFIYFIGKQYDLALSDVNESIRINPNYGEAYFNRGNILFKKNFFSKAVENYECAKRLAPFLYETFLRNAQALIQIGDFKAAISDLDLYLTKDKDNKEALLNLGIAQYRLKEYQKSLSYFDRVLEANPQSFQALINKGFILFEQKRYKDASKIFELTKKIKPNNFSGYLGLIRIYIELDQFNLAIAEFLLAENNATNLEEIEYNLSMLYLSQKNFYEGWSLYEKRLSSENYTGDYLPKKNSQDINDLNFNHRKILIYNEQGIGDQILFMSLISELDTENNSIDVVIDSKIFLLCKRSLPNFKFISKNERFCEDDYDHVIMSASLGKYLRSSILDFTKHPVGYLVSNKNKTNIFRERFYQKGKFVCGISWKSANENIGNDKSFELVQLIPILKMKNITFLNLQYGNVTKEIECVANENSIEIEQVNEIDKYNDIDGLTSLIDACDFVISVSNISAHLSGALNKKTFLLLPHSRGRLWYWHNGDERSLWYPSITQFPQKREESWDETILRLLNKIQGYLNEKIG